MGGLACAWCRVPAADPPCPDCGRTLCAECREDFAVEFESGLPLEPGAPIRCLFCAGDLPTLADLIDFECCEIGIGPFELASLWRSWRDERGMTKEASLPPEDLD